ncbi:hypothetical protein KUTeg_000155 [Tegillarca granosa]|uniref:Acyl-coenzyme A oxidase N-terminal domain-containing protein n=1 Tax=Tegillarca granosa TaxID=220873 RepID=A0ABQ9FWR5_TEGGR|nr:hypothetical protein KUTeg_000155 [Tegillarca granosa]
MEYTGVNIELARERGKTTFNVEELTTILYDGPEKLKRRRYLENLIIKDPVLGTAKPIDVTVDRNEQYEETLRRNIYFEKLCKNAGITDLEERGLMVR